MEPKRDPSRDPVTGAAAGIAACALDARQLEQQRDRYRRLSGSVAHRERTAERVVVELAPDFDRRGLEELIAVERECCPFFAIDFDESSRRLEIGVHDAQFVAALGALADQLGFPS